MELSELFLGVLMSLLFGLGVLVGYVSGRSDAGKSIGRGIMRGFEKKERD